MALSLSLPLPWSPFVAVSRYHQIRADNQKALQLFLDLRDIRGGRVVDLKQVIKTSGHNLLHECAWYDRHECARLLVRDDEAGDGASSSP